MNKNKHKPECEHCNDVGYVQSICINCHGSGEGSYDGSTCFICKGSGVTYKFCDCEFGKIQQLERWR